MIAVGSTVLLLMLAGADDIASANGESIVRPIIHYPAACRREAQRIETVDVRYDVTVEGVTSNVTILKSSHVCFNRSASASVKGMRFRPLAVDGQLTARPGNLITLTYELGGAPPPKYRMTLARKFDRIATKLQRGADPAETLRDFLEIEEKYGADFSTRELSDFHRVRGGVRMQAGDRAGALEDFRIAGAGDLEPRAAPALAKLIVALENSLAEEESAPPSAIETDPN